MFWCLEEKNVIKYTTIKHYRPELAIKYWGSTMKHYVSEFWLLLSCSRRWTPEQQYKKQKKKQTTQLDITLNMTTTDFNSITQSVSWNTKQLSITYSSTMTTIFSCSGWNMLQNISQDVQLTIFQRWHAYVGTSYFTTPLACNYML